MQFSFKLIIRSNNWSIWRTNSTIY